jgi:hypothetical protein
MENDEMSDTKDQSKLIKECGNHWNMSPEEIEQHTQFENQHPEVTLFIQEFDCHTDGYRQQWVENFQKPYCAKHPEDTRSCNTKKEDLCSTEMLNSMSNKEREVFFKRRICKLFPEAHVAVKNDPRIRKIVEEKCPEVLKKSSNQSVKEDL